MTITIEPAAGETNALFRLLEPLLPPSLHNPDSVVLATDGFRLQWRKGPARIDATVILKAEAG